MNLFRIVLHHGRTQPHVPALIDGERTLSYRELADVVARTAGHLAALGLRPGDRVGVCLKDHWEHMVLFLAIGLSGAAIVPMDWRARAAEKTRIAELLSLKFAAIEPGDPLAAPCSVLPVDETWRSAVERAAPLADPPGDWHAPLIIAPSAGTTGVPKFSIATHLQIYFRTEISADTAPRIGPRRYLSTLPLCFAGGYQRCATHLLKGDKVVLYPSLFTAAEYAETVIREKITIGLVVPSVVRQLLQIAGTGAPLLPGMESLICGGSPIFAEEKQAAACRLTPNFFEVFGTSATGGVTRLWPADLAERAESVGQPYPLVQIQVVDEAEKPLGSDAVGRLRVRSAALGSPLVVTNDPSPPTEEIRGGWYYPGELAAIDELGYLYIKGRTSDVIMRSGAKILPAEIEAVLQQHDAVVEAAVIGTRSFDNEEEVTAFVIARRPIDAGELLAHCRGRLTPYKMPREIRVVDSLPRNTAGKVAKSELAKLHAAANGARQP